jgi:hypothetical protein
MHAPNPNFFLKIKNYLTFASAGLLSKKNRFRTEPAGSRKKNRFRTEPIKSGLRGRFEPVELAGFASSGPVLVTLRTTTFLHFCADRTAKFQGDFVAVQLLVFSNLLRFPSNL